MKKIFTLIAVVMLSLVGSVSAEETVFFESTDGEAIGWGGTKVNSESITGTDLTLHVTIKTTSGEWWQFKFCQNVQDWPPIQFIGKDFVTANDVTYSWSAGTYTYDFDLTDDMITKLKSGVYAQGSINEGQLLLMKVSVTSKVNYFAKAIRTFDEPFAMGSGWDKGFLLDKELFADCEEGDILEFIKTDDSGASYSQIQTKIADTDNYLEGNKSDLNEWNCATITKLKNYRIALTANDITAAKENGIYVGGYCINVSEVNLLRTTEWPTATAINTVATQVAPSKVIKSLENGKVVIMKDGIKFNAAGQRMQ